MPTPWSWCGSKAKAILPFTERESSASAVFGGATKASTQIANMAAVVTNDILRRSALLRATLYNVSSLLRFPEAVWLAHVAKHDELAMNSKHILGLFTQVRGIRILRTSC